MLSGKIEKIGSNILLNECVVTDIDDRGVELKKKVALSNWILEFFYISNFFCINLEVVEVRTRQQKIDVKYYSRPTQQIFLDYHYSEL